MKRRHEGQPLFKPRGEPLPPNKRHRDRKNDYQRQPKHRQQPAADTAHAQ